MKIEGFYNELHPGITMHKIPVQAGFPGLVFTTGMLSVFLMGIPALIYFLVFAAVLGIGFAVLLRFIPHQAGGIAFVFSTVMFMSLVGFPAMDYWSRERERDLKDLHASIVVPPPPPPESELSAFKSDCHQHQSKPWDRTTQRDEDHKSPQRSPFDGTWEGKMNDLPGVNLIVADAGGGQPGGVVAFYFQTRGDDGEWRVAGKFIAPLLCVTAKDKILNFEVQHHKTRGSPEFGPNVEFRIELAKNNHALLYNVSEEQSEPIRLTRQE